jgi:murein DD-endopeptidase MepM/ murein hydrolase activator NlpD
MGRFPLLAILLGWNLAVTLAWLADHPAAAADPNACVGLKREMIEIRRALDHKDAIVKSLTVRLRKLARGNIQTVEKALSGTGLSVDALIKRGDGGQGGPFVPADDRLHRDVERWESLSRAVRVLPLAAPLGEYQVTSGFGKRRDPVNRRHAMHEGIDLKAPLRSPVAATAPGKVVFAGTKGGYGKMVELDHELGVRTRYAHLAAIHVKPDQAIVTGQRIGLLGSSGRSTGPHLHYEVLVDQRPSNPVRFLRAGKQLRASD